MRKALFWSTTPSCLALLPAALFLALLAAAPCAHADTDWIRGGERRTERRDAGDFWRRSEFAHQQRQQRMTTAQISQALYGNADEPYDTPADSPTPETHPAE